jgi:adenosylmethionine-8-amino-7-oxononanoate aminotransferase
MDYTLSFPAFIGLVGALGWFLVQRQITKNDKEAMKDAEAVEAKFKEQGIRIGNLTERLQSVELSMATKVSREELDKIWDKMDEMKREWKEDLRELKTDLIEAFRGK